MVVRKHAYQGAQRPTAMCTRCIAYFEASCPISLVPRLAPRGYQKLSVSEHTEERSEFRAERPPEGHPPATIHSPARVHLLRRSRSAAKPPRPFPFSIISRHAKYLYLFCAQYRKHCKANAFCFPRSPEHFWGVENNADANSNLDYQRTN